MLTDQNPTLSANVGAVLCDRPESPRSARNSQAGVTLLELVAGLAIAGLIMVPLAGIIRQFIYIPAQWSAQITVMRETRNAVRWIADDARQARSFVATSTSPDYGTFDWTDYTQSPPSNHSVRYYFISSTVTSTGSLMRQEAIDDGLPQTTHVASHIGGYADVSIQETGGLVVASVTSTAETMHDTITRNAIIKAKMRPLLPTPQPTPPPVRLAWDDFESGDLAGGGGWLGDWLTSGDANVTSTGDPFGKVDDFYLLLAGTSTTVTRSLNLSGHSNARLQFVAKVEGLSSKDYAGVQVNEVPSRFWPSETSGGVQEIALAAPFTTSDFAIAFEANISSTTGSFSIDDLKIVSDW